MEYDTLPAKEVIDQTIAALADRGVKAVLVENKEEVLEKIKEMIPQGASLMNGSSQTLQQIGFVDYLKAGQHGWNNLHDGILAEEDPVKQAALRKQAVLSDYYLGSVHGMARTGEFVIASNSGSQLPHIVYTSPNLIFVVGAQKIVPTLDEALKRLKEYVFPLEDQRMKSTGAAGSNISKLLIVEKEQSWMGRNVTVIFVNEKLGF
ncbi:lactate utilization protein [Candidatus Parcubacteria bacterium]|nr:lactate utilization protein [Candidatus Parcubacteria bacterium]